jgi:hypothetical protein
MFPTVRVLLGIVGVGLFVLGLLLITVGGESAFAGIWPLISGGVLLLAVVLERQRYRSESAERSAAPVGPGGGEPDPLPPEFTRTEERFADPTTNKVMRVFIDPKTGERRYRAE